MKWLSLGLRLMPYVITAIEGVEKLLGGKKGAEKQDAAVDILRTSLEALEAGLGKDLLDDAEANAAFRELIAAYVAVQNVIAKKKAQATR